MNRTLEILQYSGSMDLLKICNLCNRTKEYSKKGTGRGNSWVTKLFSDSNLIIKWLKIISISLIKSVSEDDGYFNKSFYS